MQALKAARVSEEQCAAFFDQLAKSERPLIYAGGGVINSDASGELRSFAGAFRIPVVTTLLGIGAIDTTHEMSMHMLGMHGMAYANYAVEDCDFLIAVGSRFDDRVAGKVHEFAPRARFLAHIDIDAAEIGKVKNVTWSFVGDARTGLATSSRRGGRASRKTFPSGWPTFSSSKRNTRATTIGRAS